MTTEDILRMCSGRRVQRQPGLRMGEIAVVRTEDKEAEWLEAREALRMKLGGEVVCRVW
jgi:ribosomal protein S8